MNRTLSDHFTALASAGMVFGMGTLIHLPVLASGMIAGLVYLGLVAVFLGYRRQLLLLQRRPHVIYSLDGTEPLVVHDEVMDGIRAQARAAGTFAATPDPAVRDNARAA